MRIGSLNNQEIKVHFRISRFVFDMTREAIKGSAGPWTILGQKNTSDQSKRDVGDSPDDRKYASSESIG